MGRKRGSSTTRGVASSLDQGLWHPHTVRRFSPRIHKARKVLDESGSDWPLIATVRFNSPILAAVPLQEVPHADFVL